MEVRHHGVEIEGLEFLGVVERLVHRIGQDRMLMQHLKVQLVRPPVSVHVCAGVPGEGALVSVLVIALGAHVSLRLVASFFV
jgi:hypothetical protein